MKKSLYSIYDTVAEVFNNPFTELTDASAIRAFQMAMKKTETSKDDYSLYKISNIDDNNGEINNDGCPKKIYSGLDIKPEE